MCKSSGKCFAGTLIAVRLFCLWGLFTRQRAKTSADPKHALCFLHCPPFFLAGAGIAQLHRAAWSKQPAPCMRRVGGCSGLAAAQQMRCLLCTGMTLQGTALRRTGSRSATTRGLHPRAPLCRGALGCTGAMGRALLLSVTNLNDTAIDSCPQCLPSDIVPIRSWTRTLRRPGIRHRHLPYHAMPALNFCNLTRVSREVGASLEHVCLVTLSLVDTLSEAGPGRFGRQTSVTDIYHTIPYHTIPYHASGSQIKYPLAQIAYKMKGL